MEAVGVVVTVGLIVAVGATDRQTDEENLREEENRNSCVHAYACTCCDRRM